MRVVSSAEHLRHRPLHEYADGQAIACFETPERAEAIRQALERDSAFAFEPPTEHGLEPITAVHDHAMVDYLATAWAGWEAAGETAPEILPDTFALPAYHEGMERPRTSGHPRGRVGTWVFDATSPIVEGTYEASRAAVDVALTAADLVLAGERSAYGLCRPPGHHAARSMMGGYCYFNNAAIVADDLARRTGGRVAILDVDYHHGNGTQQIFYARPEVLYVSLHGDPDRAYPYFSGFAEERGAGAGAGTTLNLPLPAGCSDEEYLVHLDHALEAVDAFGDAPLVVSLGVDTYGRDPICDLALTTGAYREVGRRVGALGRSTVVLQEGGYFIPAIGENVRTWLTGLAEAQ
ncbi:MAG TPA: histone deacetylase family protein [Actinomycetota bacterium]|jgi:acetoin utilization deacetylase AcuC-like enzyme|nr:histone deacetylase family protein [Actinomycetota bacterium]